MRSFLNCVNRPQSATCTGEYAHSTTQINSTFVIENKQKTS